MSKQLVISVMSKDRAGIIADISGAILELGGDLADLTQSVLGGYFSMMLIAEFDEKVTAEDVLAKFSHIESETKIEATIKEMAEPLDIEKKKLPVETFILAVQAENRKGLVKAVGDFLYLRNINVLDLETRRTKDQYTMIYQVDLTKISDTTKLREELSEFGESEGLDIVLQHDDIFKATHEITL